MGRGLFSLLGAPPCQVPKRHRGASGEGQCHNLQHFKRRHSHSRKSPSARLQAWKCLTTQRSRAVRGHLPLPSLLRPNHAEPESLVLLGVKEAWWRHCLQSVGFAKRG